MNRQKIIQTVVLVFAIGVLVTMVLGLRSQGSAVGIGDEGYNFELEDMDGNTHQLSDYKGEVVILNFFASWCEPCKAEAPELEKFHAEFKDQANLLIVVKGETKNTVKRYIDEMDSKKKYIFDFNNNVSRSYGAVGQPETIIINQEGIIVDHIIGGVSRDYLAVKLDELMN
ncbi:TlpA disulfide reductase family protein [Bacillaceae bacterium IKA-2]|nr:TlpA disulfide reductase family protein [Bacillaceae bacterium IKA-2]